MSNNHKFVMELTPRQVKVLKTGMDMVIHNPTGNDERNTAVELKKHFEAMLSTIIVLRRDGSTK